jgi:PIN like domain
VLLEAMRAAGANVRHVGDAVPYGSADEDWLTEIGSRGWIALMRDQKVRKRPLEIAALKAAGVAAFAYTGGQATALNTAEAICPRLVKFANMAVSEPKPFLFTFGVAGSLSRVRFK